MQDLSSSIRSTQTKAGIIRNTFLEYCSTTTIHGIPYLTERKRHWTEKCFWAIVLGLSVWTCGSMIRDIWIKWRDYPTTMSLTEEPLPISTIPFPTVTVCPRVKTLKEKLDLTSLFGLPADLWNLSDVESARLKIVLHLCTNFWPDSSKSYDHFTDVPILDVIEDVAPVLNETMEYCSWFRKRDGCEDAFVPIITDEGLCFSFNALNSNDIYAETMAPEMMNVVDRPKLTDWSLENGYNNADGYNNKSVHPIRVFSGQQNGLLSFDLSSADVNIEHICNDEIPGFKVFLHTPGDVLKGTDISFLIPFSQSVKISITPTLITTADGLRKYKPSQRKCYFNSDRRLRFFRFYTEENCKFECLANYTVQECECVKFSMPRNESTRICGPTKIPCYRLAAGALFEEDIIEGLSNENAKLFRRNCNCLPACTSIKYEVDVDRAKIDWKEVSLRIHKIPLEQLAKLQKSRVEIFFQSYQISALKREEQYTDTDFLAICGGILGLCLGFSGLSIIEFVYFATLRLFWSMRKRKSENVIAPVPPVKQNKTKNPSHFYCYAKPYEWPEIVISSQ